MIQGGTIQVQKRETEMIICNLTISLLLLSLSVSGTTNRTELHCNPVIKVPRNTVFKARVMTVLRINCTVNLRGCHRSPRVSWCKIDGNDCKALNHSDYIKTEWKNTTEHEGMAFLFFLNISMEDAGLYRCKESETSVGHAINVTVTENKEDEVSHNQNNTILDVLNTDHPKDDQQWLWPYVYICTGIAGLVFIIMTVSLLFIRCQGTKSTRKDMANKNQYMETQSSDLPPPPPPPAHPHHNTRPPSHQPTSALYRVCETPPVRGAPSAGRVSVGRHNTVGTERGEEENVLVYASLNHQPMSRGPRRTARQEPEPSEYAAIRFR
ncbi:B- and T-lymphocyte attenuator-like isoform X2 [Megalobrama amblycephala]|uniref:B- and T-lymphocyte attenuator-like isoform X2 n=1 Tax=Megalobrama amblycephala TaxID=75352 RepID=UPI002013C58B|nr:B- and T-lymphocyte attenuator-like isoform X2 [Megalobrama amblycephala]